MILRSPVKDQIIQHPELSSKVKIPGIEGSKDSGLIETMFYKMVYDNISIPLFLSTKSIYSDTNESFWVEKINFDLLENKNSFRLYIKNDLSKGKYLSIYFEF